jgi:4-hydroxybenzoate polyprenyltransferase
MFRHLVTLMRPKHYIKNGLVALPLLFSGQLFQGRDAVKVLIGIALFSLVSSIVYIFNDIRDVEKDRKHPKKKCRPLASGAVKVWQAYVLGLVLAGIVVLGTAAYLTASSAILLVVYLAINIAYSLGLKNIPVIDIAILASGFVIRVLFGASIIDVAVSAWLYLTMLAGAFYASLGKRRNEIMVNGTASRKVNESYTLNFLDKSMYVFLALVLVFYSLWAIDPMGGGKHSLSWTIPVIMLIFLTYGLAIGKKGAMGDPVDMILGNKTLIFLLAAYGALTVWLLYI